MSEIIQFLIAHGGLILFAIALSEQIGLPFPGVPWYIAAGALAASGKFNLLGAIGWTTLGCVGADAILFCLGERGRTRVFRAFPHLQAVQVKLERATLARAVLHGTRVMTLAKFIPLGQIAAMHAGAMQVNRLRFLLVDAFSSAVYAAVFASLGYAFHDQLEQLVAFLRKLGTISFVVIAVLAAAYVLHMVLKHRAAPRKPEAALI